MDSPSSEVIKKELLSWKGVTTHEHNFTSIIFYVNGFEMGLPVSIVVQTELVPKQKALAAMTLFSVAIYIGLGVGPLLGGLVVAAAGPWAVFMLNALSFAGIIVFLHRWHRDSEQKLLPPEHVIGAIRTGLRYMRHSLHVRALFVRDFALTICGSALISLLPLLARNEAGSNSILFGILVGAFGIGGMIGGLVIVPRIKTVSIEKRVITATIVFAASMAILSFQHDAVTLFVGVFAVGTALVVTNSSLNFVAYNCIFMGKNEGGFSTSAGILGRSSHGQHNVGNCCRNLGNSNNIARCINRTSNWPCCINSLQIRATH